MPTIAYIQITSPIRRGPDFVNHEIGKELRHNDNFLMDQEKMQELESKLVVLGSHLSKLERNAESCERDVDSFEMAYYMENHIGEQFEGTIDGIITKGFFIETDNLISGLVPAVTLPGNYVYNENLMAFTSPQDHRGYRLGDKVTAECVGANRYDRTVDFKLTLKKENK
jgi:ribonuclease R